MLIVLSPAKTLDYDTPVSTDVHSVPEFIDRAAELIDTLRALSPMQVSSLMGISDALAVLNVTRYASWSRQFTRENAKQAILAFNGDVYEGLDAATLSPKQLDYAQSCIRILSGLYGLLRPLDLMQPYRLEMGTRLANGRGKDLYAFWGNVIADNLNALMVAQKTKVVVNLASEEYFKAVKPNSLKAEIIHPVFEDWKGGRYKIISFYAKRARGLMARYAVLRGISEPEQLKTFNMDGYAYDEAASTAQKWVFRRRLDV